MLRKILDSSVSIGVLVKGADVNVLLIAQRSAQVCARILGAVCCFMSVLLVGSLIYMSDGASYFYYADDVVGGSQFFFIVNTIAHGSWYYLGCASWLLAPALAYCGLLLLGRLPLRHEWDRLCAVAALFVAVPTLCALWRTVCPVRMAGFLGNVIVAHGAYVTDSFVMAITMAAIAAASIVVITRSAVIVMLCRACEFVHAHRLIGRSMFAIKVIAIGVYTLGEKSVKWCWCLVSNRIGEKYPELNEYQLEETEDASLGDIARDTFWESYNDEMPMVHTQGTRSTYDQLSASVAQPVPNSVQSTQATSEPLGSVPTVEHQSYEIHDPQPEDEVSVQQMYRLPDLSIFTAIPIVQRSQGEQDALRVRAHILEDKLKHFGIAGKVVSIEHGPVITLFEYQPNVDMKISKILALEDDLALALQAMSIRILAPVPGKPVVGFEVANQSRRDVFVSEIVHSSAFRDFTGALPLILGQDTIGNNVIIDLLKSPHLLVAGSTGSGKSVALNTMLVSLLCSKSPDELRLILIDPKRLEFATFADLPHLLCPIVVQPNRAIEVLKWVVHTMESRYDHMAEQGVRGITDFHEKFGEAGKKEMPFIVVVIDELADLMMTTGKQVEDLIARIAQMARAAGIHMILATQRPSVDVITGLIKVNFPSRISFRVTSKVDSRTILDCAGAEKLLGRGDMLYMDAHGTNLSRVHGAYVSDAEIEAVVQHARSERSTQYLDLSQFEASTDKGALMEGDDSLYTEVLGYLDDVEEVSISLLQRKFRIGYNRSARIIAMLEGEGRILSSDGGKMRKVVRLEG